MKQKYLFLYASVLLVNILFAYNLAFASEKIPDTNYLNIATMDSRPLSIDRLLYLAFKNIGYNAEFTCSTMEMGYGLANSGERDGVISLVPDEDSEDGYSNLIKVDVPLEETSMYAVVRKGSYLDTNQWSDLSGRKVGVLSQRKYINTRVWESSPSEMITKENNSLLLDGLINGEYDIVVLSLRNHEKYLLPEGLAFSGRLDTQPEYLYLHKSRENIVPEITQSLWELFADGRAEKILLDIPVPEINQEKTVLHIFSHSIDLDREEQLSAAVRRSLNDVPVEWYNVALDTRRFSREPGRTSFIETLLRQDCVSRNIVAIIVSGDDALEFLERNYYFYFRNVPVLFYGISSGYEDRIRGFEQYFTGVVDNLEADETIKAALELFPETKNLFVLNDNSTEGRIYRSIIENQLRTFEGLISIEYNKNVGFETLLSRMRELPEDSVVLVGSYFVDSHGRYYNANEMIRLLSANCNVPLFSLRSTKPEYGAIGGKCLDYEKHGEIIAAMLQDLLAGAPVTELPIVSDTKQYNRWVFDRIKLDEFNIRESSLPPDSQVVNKLPSIWESDPLFAITLITLLVTGIFGAVGISVFLFQRRRRREKRINDAKIRSVKERLERIISTSPVLFAITVDGVVVDLNENMRNDTGLNIGDKAIDVYTNPDDRNSSVERVMRDGIVENEIIEFNFTDGKIHRCLMSFATADYDGKDAIVLWMVDIENSETQKDELHAARQTLQTILDSMPVSVMLTDSEKGTIVYANNTCLLMFGYSTLQDIQGMPVSKLAPELEGEGPNSLNEVTKALDSDSTVDIELEYIKANGTTFDARITVCSSHYNGRKTLMAIIVDLAKEREAQRMRENLQAVLDMLPIPVRIASLEDSTLLYTNNAGAEMFGFQTPESVYRKPILSFMPEVQPDGMTTVEKINSIMNLPEPRYSEFRCIKVTGEEFDAGIIDRIIDYNGERASLGIIMDLTAEKEYQRMLNDTAEKEREANQLKSRFLVNMSHEIRTPMNAIIGLTEIELHKNAAKETSEIYKKINTSAKNLLEIINDILDLSKIEADKIELYEEEFELEDVLNSALLVASPRLDGKNVEFMLNQSLDLPRFLFGDRTRLWQILKNFLDNSAKFTDDGKIVLTAFAEHEQSDDETVMLVFIIEDTGLGMDEEQLKRVFLPYEQIYNRAQKMYTGTGLGMAISKQLCELMGGHMTIESHIGKGTSVCMHIPFKRSHNTDTGREALKTSALAGINILAVDEDMLSLEIMEGILKSVEANCTVARSGMEAMDIILEHRDRGEFFDIILLDYIMDDLDGLETARQIHLALSAAPKLLMVTAYEKLLLKSEMERYCIDDVIEKPFIPSAFIQRLCNALGVESEITANIRETYVLFDDVRVLLCEDYRLNQEVAEGMLAQFGIETVIAEDGSQAIERLNAGEKFDLIFMDLQMPVMDGYEATVIIRENPEFDHIPIISLTADAMTEIVDKCLEMGMNDHIAKPVEFDRLHDILCKWLPKSKRAGEAANTSLNPLNEALARFGGDIARYEKALEEFSDFLPDKWLDFQSAVERKEETERFLHKLKGAAGNMSEKEIYKSVAAFESSLRVDDPDIALYEQLIKVCGTAKKRISEQTKNAKTGELEEGTHEEFKEHMKNLEAALEDYNPITSVDIINELKEKAWKWVDKSILEKVYELTRRYEFEEALDTLSLIMENEK